MMDITPTDQQPSNNNNNNSCDAAANTATVVVVLYVVQKCWFAGPKTFDPVDYGRLFADAAAAETLAYQSAHAHAAAQGEKVRTLQLQQPPTASQGRAAALASYGFAAAGALFWIRGVSAAVVGEWSHPAAAGAQVLLGTQHTLWSAVGQNRVAQQQQQLAGAGNTSSHPITIFCGTGAAAAAQEAVQRLPDCGIASSSYSSIAPRVAWWPVGPPPANAWWKEWRSIGSGMTHSSSGSSLFQPQQQSSSPHGAAPKRTVAATCSSNVAAAAAPVLLSWNALLTDSSSSSSPNGGSSDGSNDNMMSLEDSHQYPRQAKQRRMLPSSHHAELPPVPQQQQQQQQQAMMW